MRARISAWAAALALATAPAAARAEPWLTSATGADDGRGVAGVAGALVSTFFPDLVVAPALELSYVRGLGDGWTLGGRARAILTTATLEVTGRHRLAASASGTFELAARGAVSAELALGRSGPPLFGVAPGLAGSVRADWGALTLSLDVPLVAPGLTGVNLRGALFGAAPVAWLWRPGLAGELRVIGPVHLFLELHLAVAGPGTGLGLVAPGASAGVAF